MKRNRQRGFTIATFALLLGGLMAMAALAVDVGVLYTARTSAQHAADAAALAAAFTFVDGTTDQPTAAINSAIAVAAQNKVMGQPVTITPANVSVDLANQRVTVTVPRTGANGIATFFASTMGIASADVQTKATAQAWNAGATAQCLKPIFLANTVLSRAPDNATACSRGEVLFDPRTYRLSEWAASRVPTTAPITIRPTTPSASLMPSQFYSLDFGDGGSTYRCTIGKCLYNCGVTSISCGTSLPIETGTMKGPTKQGVNELIGKPPTDTWIGPGEYDTPNGLSTTSRALVVTPVWDSCDPANALSPGKTGQTVKIVGFVTAFIAGVSPSGDNVQAYIVNRTICSGVAGGGPTSTATGPYGIPVRLVQNP